MSATRTTPRPPQNPLRRKLALYGLLLGVLIAGAGLLTDPRFRGRGGKSTITTPATHSGQTGSSGSPSSPSAGGTAAPRPVSYELFGPAGPSAGVDPQLLASLAIPAEQAAAVNELVKSFWQQESARLQPRWTPVPAETDATRRTLLAKADPSDAAFSLQALRARLQAALGTGTAGRLLPYLSGPMAFGSLGANDIKVTLTRPATDPAVTAPGDTLRLDGEIQDAASGAVLFTFRAATPESIQAWLGTSLANQTPPP